MKRVFLAGCFSVGLLAAGLVLDTPKARASCLSGSYYLSGEQTNCKTFDPSTVSNASPDYAYVQYFDNSVVLDSYFQIAFYDAKNIPVDSSFTITDLSYGFTNTIDTLPSSWAAATPSTLTACDACTNYFSNVISLGSVPTSKSFWVRYRISADNSLYNGAELEVNLLGNNNGATDTDGLLRGATGSETANKLLDLSNYNRVVSSNILPTPAPGPLPVAGVLAALGMSRQLRRRIRQAG